MIILLLNNLRNFQMMVFINGSLTFHAIFVKIFDLECLFIKLFIIVVLVGYVLFLFRFQLLLSDLITLYLDPWINYLDYLMEYHKEYQINYLLVNLINLLFTMFLKYEVNPQSISLDNYKIIHLIRCLICLIQSQVGFQLFVIITIDFVFAKSNQATKFLNSIKNIEDLILTELMKPT